MKITKKQLTPVISIVAVIAAFALLFATYSTTRSNLGTSEAFMLPDVMDDLTEQISDEPLKVFTDNSRSMYVSNGGVVTVKDDTTNTVLWSNQANEDDVLIFGEEQAAKSPITITYRYNGETDTNLYSMADAVDNNQYTVSISEDGNKLLVTYLLGEAGDGGLLPKAFTQKFFEGEILSKLDKDTKDYLLERYVLYKKGTADSTLIKEFSGMEKEDIYYLESPGSYVIQTKIISYLQQAGLTTQQYKKQCEITGEAAEIYNENFMITVEYWLDGEDIMINVPGDKIYYHPEHPLTTITLNGAATYAVNSESGEYLLPAGSGAIQDFAVKSERNNNYTYYGKDYLNTVSTVKETMFPLPVYAVMRDGKNGLLGIVENGAEVAVLNERFTNGASQLTLSLKLLEYGDASVTAQQSSTVYCSSQFKDNFTVRYRVTEADADAIDIASQYRELLINQNKMPNKVKSNESALIEIVGNVPYSYQWFGLFTVNKQIMLTEWNEAEQIVSAFTEKGLNPAIKLSGFNSKGLFCQSPGKYDFIGSKKERNSFLNFTKKNSINTYLDVSLAYNYTGASGLFSGYNAGKHSARAPGNDNGERPIVSKSTGFTSAKASTAEIVSPKMFAKYAASYNKLDDRLGICLGDSLDSLNTDYSEKAPHNRADTLNSLKETVVTLSEKRNIIGNNPIIPVLNYISISENLTLTGDKEYSFSKYVPFVQSVLHGCVNYTTDSLNSYNDYELALLEAVSTGSTPKYTVSYKFDRDVMNTEYDFLYYTDWSNWKDKILSDIADIDKLYNTISEAYIIGYTNTGDVSVTSYSNGINVYVNYTEKDIAVGDITIPALQFVSIKNS